jgi:hypothetical protein
MATDELQSLKAQVAGLWARYREAPSTIPAPTSSLTERLRVLGETQRQLATRRAQLKDQHHRQRRALGLASSFLHGLGVALGLAFGVALALAAVPATEHTATPTRQMVLFAVGLLATLAGAWRLQR